MNTGEFTIVLILPSYRIEFLILIFSVRFQKNNLKLICWLAIWMRFVTFSVRIHKQQLKFNLFVTTLKKQLMNWAILPKTEGKSSVQKEMKLQKKSVMVEFKVFWQLVRLRHPKFIYYTRNKILLFLWQIKQTKFYFWKEDWALDFVYKQLRVFPDIF